MFPVRSNSNADALYITNMMERYKFRSVIDRVYPLLDVANVFRYAEAGMTTGHVVIAIDDTAI